KRGAAYVTGCCTLLAGGLVLGTWRALVVNLWVGLAGRAWMIPAHSFLVSLVMLRLLGEWASWNAAPDRRSWLGEWPCVAMAVIAAKFLTAGWLLLVRVHRGVLDEWAAGRAIGGWALAAVALFLLLDWLVPPELVPGDLLAIAVILLLPLARPKLAPLALAWNRHR
ncbi:MAG TPA: hypothetical protein VH092_05380, partial [Urbifossiella sp.]|nr:hypothetical protein [Urbifossiella sp.]